MNSAEKIEKYNQASILRCVFYNKERNMFALGSESGITFYDPTNSSNQLNSLSNYL